MKLNKKSQVISLTNQIITLKSLPPSITTKKTIQKLQQRIDNIIKENKL